MRQQGTERNRVDWVKVGEHPGGKFAMYLDYKSQLIQRPEAGLP